MSSRQLSALIRWLPEDSAVHRAQTDGRVWTTRDAVLWESLHSLSVIGQLVGRTLTKKQAQGLKLGKWPQFPWSEDQGASTKIGKVHEGDQLAAAQYLLGMIAKE